MTLKEMIADLNNEMKNPSKKVSKTLMLSKITAIISELEKEPTPEITDDTLLAMGPDLRKIAMMGAMVVITQTILP